MGNSFGLKEGDIKSIISILQQQPEVEEALIFGSRAKGNYKTGSDVDMAIKGDGINLKIITHISYLLNEETIMPYQFDVINYHSIRNAELIEHIDRAGISFYKKSS
ncbi:MAG TPA: nucleotidyltransferase domain-containing protein [Hanamia sp.]|nr:nucleotidyltransferase domain-containing protein [Hanamia sp.]